MSAIWIRGTFEGECQGGLAPPPDLTRPDARWYGLTLRHGVLRDARIVDVPPPAAAEKVPFQQARLDECVFVSPNGIDDWHQASVFDVRVHDWQLAHHVEANNHTWAVMRGTLYARVDDGAPEPKVIVPAPPVEPSDIGPVPVLLLLLWLVWLWLTCGWVTCCVWAVPIALSHWRFRANPRAGASVLEKGVHGALGVVLFALSLGVFARAVFAGLDECEFSVWLPAGFLLLCMAAASALVVSFPMLAIWALWSMFVSMACFRSEAVCTDASRPKAIVRQVVAEVAPLVGLGEEGSGEKGTGGAGTSTLAGGTSSGQGQRQGKGQGSGSGQGQGSGSGQGQASGSGQGQGSGSGQGQGSGSGQGQGSGSGQGQGSGSGQGQGSGSGQGQGSGSGQGQGSGSGQGEGSGESGSKSEGRVSVDDALDDPSKFYGDKPKAVGLQGDLLFDFDSDRLKASAQPKLERLAKLIRMRDERRVVLEGHSDGIGESGYNQGLSERRAQAVREWLIDQEHINPGQLEAKGLGTRRPVVPLTGNRDAQQPNRRVEVRVVESSDPL